jgi:hypothetical protein
MRVPIPQGVGLRICRSAVVVLLLSVTVSCASTRTPGRNTALWVATYPVNRVLDVLDVVSISAGVYFPSGAEIHVTRAAQLGLMLTVGAEVGWWPNRELGFGTEVISSEPVGDQQYKDSSTRAAFGPWSWGRTEYWRWGTRGRRHGAFHERGLNRARDSVHPRHQDYWGIGASVKAGVGCEIEFHPVEFADAVCGFFFVDFQWDDIGHTRPKAR